MNMKNAISVKMENKILTVDCSNLDGALLCACVLNRVNWTDNLGKGKYRIVDFGKMYKLITQINKYNATDDVLFARNRLFAGWTLF